MNHTHYVCFLSRFNSSLLSAEETCKLRKFIEGDSRLSLLKYILNCLHYRDAAVMVGQWGQRGTQKHYGPKVREAS